MRVVIQRAKDSKVEVDGKIIGQIKQGLLILLGVEEDDSTDDIDWLCRKIVNMRIFSDKKGKMNLSVKEVDGNILLVSQFTLHASTKKGNRPSFVKSANAEKAEELYEKMIAELSIAMGKQVESGEFGADMKVSLINDGPVTIIMDSKNRE